MTRGHKPRKSLPNETRVITWRINGELHNLLIRVCKQFSGMSHNRLITEIMQAKLYELDKGLNKEQPPEDPS